jgi:hypothetical protein
MADRISCSTPPWYSVPSNSLNRSGKPPSTRYRASKRSLAIDNSCSRSSGSSSKKPFHYRGACFGSHIQFQASSRANVVSIKPERAAKATSGLAPFLPSIVVRSLRLFTVEASLDSAAAHYRFVFVHAKHITISYRYCCMYAIARTVQLSKGIGLWVLTRSEGSSLQSGFSRLAGAIAS